MAAAPAAWLPLVCPWCLLRLCLGMAEMMGMLLVLLCASHASARCGIQKYHVIEDSEEGLVSEMEFPWVVSLQNSRHTHLAFGSILSEFWILSVASAFEHRTDAIAIVGIAKMNATVISHEEYPVNTIIIHEGFDNETMTNNLALLKTDTAMHFSSLVESICFLRNQQYTPLASRNCWVAGWNPTFATGNQMTMSILRKISVQDLDLCPAYESQQIGCGSHVQEETHTVCLGDPGNPLMCQLQQSNLWVLRGILSQGGEKCPGLFLYIRVEDYSDWLTFKTKATSLPLSAFHQHREFFTPSYSYSTHTTVTQEKYSTPGQDSSTQTQFQEQTNVTIFMAMSPWEETSSTESVEDDEKDVRELGNPEDSVQSSYYDYYKEGVKQIAEPASGQNRLHQPQEMTWLSFVFVFFCNGIESRS